MATRELPAEGGGIVTAARSTSAAPEASARARPLLPPAITPEQRRLSHEPSGFADLPADGQSSLCEPQAFCLGSRSFAPKWGVAREDACAHCVDQPAGPEDLFGCTQWSRRHGI